MELEREDFEILWNIANSWQTDPEKAASSADIGAQACHHTFIRLENMGLIELEFQEGKISMANITDEGRKAVEDEQYADWAPE